MGVVNLSKNFQPSVLGVRFQGGLVFVTSNDLIKTDSGTEAKTEGLFTGPRFFFL